MFFTKKKKQNKKPNNKPVDERELPQGKVT